MLPIFKDENRNLSMMQTAWASQLNPIIINPLSSMVQLDNITLISGVNTINHKLGKVLQGWFVTRMQNSFVQLYDLQNTNNMQDKTLILNSSGAGLISLIVF